MSWSTMNLYTAFIKAIKEIFEHIISKLPAIIALPNVEWILSKILLDELGNCSSISITYCFGPHELGETINEDHNVLFFGLWIFRHVRDINLSPFPPFSSDNRSEGSNDLLAFSMLAIITCRKAQCLDTAESSLFLPGWPRSSW